MLLQNVNLARPFLMHMLHSPNVVTWIAKGDFAGPLYISDHYNSIWERSNSDLFDDYLGFNEHIYPEDLKTFSFKTKVRMTTRHAPVTIFYRIVTPSGAVKCIKDISLLLININSSIIHIGFACELDEKSWEHAQVSNKALADEYDQVCAIMNKFVGMKAEHIPRKDIHDDAYDFDHWEIYYRFKKLSLSPRQTQCVGCLFLGKTIKETARIINVSPRTVETYLEQVRHKLEFKTKLELVANLDFVVAVA